MTWQEIWVAGLGAAIVSGITAAGTAVLVVQLTNRSQGKQAQLLEAREAARQILLAA